MAESKTRFKKVFEDLVNKKVGQICRYRNLINALVATHVYFNKKEKYSGYLGGKIDGLTPDIVIKGSEGYRDIIGDGKKGLPAPPMKQEIESWSDYYKRKDVIIYMEKTLKDLNDNISKYSIKLANISEPHDYFILCPTDKRSALKIIEKNNALDKNAIILSFSFSGEEQNYILRIVKEKGSFADEDINNDLDINQIVHIMQDSAELMSKHKLYLAEKEDHEAPIEWIMLIIWQYILPEIAQTNEKKMIIAKLAEGYVVVEVTLKQISDFIKDKYKLPTFNGNKELVSYSVIKKAMTEFAKLTDVKIIEGEESPNPKYRITWSKLPTNNLLTEFVKKVHGDEFEKIAKQEANKPEPIKLSEDQKRLNEFSNS